MGRHHKKRSNVPVTENAFVSLTTNIVLGIVTASVLIAATDSTMLVPFPRSVYVTVVFLPLGIILLRWVLRWIDGPGQYYTEPSVRIKQPIRTELFVCGFFWIVSSTVLFALAILANCYLDNSQPIYCDVCVVNLRKNSGRHAFYYADFKKSSSLPTDSVQITREVYYELKDNGGKLRLEVRKGLFGAMCVAKMNVLSDKKK